MCGQSAKKKKKNEERDAKLLNVKADHETRKGIFLVVPPPPPPLCSLYALFTLQNEFEILAPTLAHALHRSLPASDCLLHQPTISLASKYSSQFIVLPNGVHFTRF